MPPFGPIKRKLFVKYLKQVGFTGPYSGGRHQFMIKNDITIYIPNPHKSDINKNLLSRILRQSKISRKDWEML